MPPRITDSQRKAVLALLAQGLTRETVAAKDSALASATCSVTNRWAPERYELALWSYLTSLATGALSLPGS
jgi:hypothetical protein